MVQENMKVQITNGLCRSERQAYRRLNIPDEKSRFALAERDPNHRIKPKSWQGMTDFFMLMSPP